MFPRSENVCSLSLPLTMHEIGQLADVFIAVARIGNLEMLRP
jgi:hypothetical protein